MGWGGRWEGGSGLGIHVNPWLIHVKVWQNSLQYCKVISLQLIKINGKKRTQYNLPKINLLSFLSILLCRFVSSFVEYSTRRKITV